MNFIHLDLGSLSSKRDIKHLQFSKTNQKNLTCLITLQKRMNTTKFQIQKTKKKVNKQ